MGKLLTGIFVGVFTGALVYEVLKRSNNELARKCCDGIDKVADGIRDMACGRAKSEAKAPSKMKSIPVE
ncbi:MAG TPA: hypothetical protein ENI77_08130 [Nitrospirae bacterium]|nr:hypothetical protein [Nitrospirota bacterium]